MELKQTVINNSGMSQDFSISKQDNKFAFENRNVRIQSTNDGTLLSITNLRDPLQTNTYVGCHKVIGHCVTPNYIIIFALNRVRHGSIFVEYSTIYRIDLDSVESTENACKVLYNQPNKGNGALNLDSNFYIDTLYFEEGEYIKKVYWTDGKNNPRVINIITPGERVETGKVFQTYEKNVFEFYPEIYNESYGSIPKITVTKNRSVASELPAGMIQYFISYYNVNGAESLIVNSSDLYTIDYSDRGAKADETGMCAFNVSIPGNSVNKDFDYIRVYSAIRTSYNGPLVLKIVGDIEIDPNFNGDYTIIDNGILQEQLQDGFIYFIGGTPFIAKTLTEKDNTAFFGNIKTESVIIPENIRTLINNIFFKDDSQFSKSEIIKFTLNKKIPLGKDIYSGKYQYTLQLDKGSKSYKTFKSGEIYRFGIQFQTRKGQWTDVAWIGDVECTEKPKFDSDSNCFLVNDVEFHLPSNSDFIDALNAEHYINYRILYADPEYSNGRKIKAQGVLCPTLFTPGQRAMNAPYSLPSWVMRPKNSKIAHHHFEPLFSAEVDGAEIAGYTRHQKDGVEVNAEYTVPYIKVPKDSGERENKECYVVTYLTISKGNKLMVRSVKVWVNPEDVKNNFYDSNGNEPTDYEIICDYCVPYGGNYNEYGKALMADPKSGSKNNPYGYIGKEGVYNTYHQEDTDDTAHTTGGVKGWIPAFKEEGLPIQWIPSPNLLGDASYDLYWGTSNVSLFYGASLPYDRDEDFYLCSHAGEYISISKKVPNEFLSLKFLPVYGFSTDASRWATPRTKSGAQSQTHSGANYNTEDGLKDSDDLLFSKTKTFFKLEVTTFSGASLESVCTLPEIFRPRCTVDGTNNQSADWGDDASNYIHKYNSGENSYDGIEGSWVKRESYIQIIPFNESFRQKEIEKSMNDYYVDESILTLHSPDIDNVSKDNRSIKLSVVGAIPLKYSQINLDSQINAYASVLGGLNLNTIAAHNKEHYSPFYTDYFYNDIGWDYYSEGGTTEPEESLLISIPSTYKTYLFPANNFLGITSDEELSHLNRAFTEYPGIIKKQQIYNQYFSENTVYFKNPCDFDTVYCGKVTEDGESVTFNTSLNFGIYRPSYDNLVTSENTSHIYNNGSKIKNKLSFGTTRVKFSTTPHLILNLQDLDNKSHKYILPHFATESFFRDVIDGKKYVWNEDSVETVEEGVTILAPRDLSDARKEWAQNSFNLNEYHIESIWDVPERSEVSPTTEDYFTFYNMDNLGRPDDGDALKNRLNNYYGSDIISFILNNYTPQVFDDNVTHYVSEQNNPKVLVGVYRWLQVGQGRQHKLSTELGYIRDFILNSDESAINAFIYEEIPSPFSDASNISLKTGAEETDYNVVYKYHRVGSEPNIYPFYFKWYLNKGVDETEDFWNYVERAEPYFPVQYESKTLATTESSYNSEYLFVGEVYYDIPNDLLYGGTSQTALKKLTWIPSSDIAPIVTRRTLNNMEGDTYYQRWDCLKTYPTTEEDANQIVDVTSFMVETHKNLDGRSDVWRGVPNLMARPTNFNLFNTVYNQSNNIFEYVISESQNISTDVPNQIIWSMSKNRFGDVDSWTNTNTSSSTTVKYPVTKLLNYNNSVMALTENSVEVVNFNAKQLIPSTDNSFVELQNSNKVDGTVKLQAPYGTYNMNTLITEKGLYFIDDNEKSIIRIGGEAGITKIGITSLGDFLKENIIKGTYVWSYRKPFRFEYDSVHKDIYLINDTHCIVYNETLDAFTSFIDYTGEYWLYNYNGKLFAYRHDDEENSLVVHNMYAGDGYNRDFQPLSTEEERNLLEYSVWYRINPNSYSDKVFTNGTLAADCGVVGNDYPLPNSTKITQFFSPFYKEPEDYINLNIPFDNIRVWNEYQDTEDVPLVNVLDTRSTLKQKFRFWRFEIPRDKHSNFKRDRIRNPWIHLQLKGHSDKKMEFHNLTIQYME